MSCSAVAVVSRGVTYLGFSIFLALLALAFLSTGGDFFGGVVRDGTPPNFVFVGLTQVLMMAWLCAGVLAVFESKNNARDRNKVGDAMLATVFGRYHQPPVTSAQVGVISAVGAGTRASTRRRHAVMRLSAAVFNWCAWNEM
jgi:hypothetical protein